MAVRYTKDFILYDVSPEEVYLSGSWCDWKPNAIKMTKIPNLYFIATVELPYNTKIAYKYIVNGNWMTNPEEQTETDAAGNTNNVFTTPSEAEAPKAVAPVAAASSGITAPLTSSSTSAGNATNTGGSGAHEIQEAKESGVPVGGAVAGSGIAAAAAGTAAAAGLGHGQSSHDGGKEEILEAKTSGVPVGAAVARSGIAEDAAQAASAHTLHHNSTGSEGVTGVEKVAPNVTQASSSATASGVASDRDLAKSDVGSSTSAKAPLPASTADAPVAPGSATHDHEGKGLFSVIGGLGAAAAAAAAKAAYDLEHKIEERLSDSASDKRSASGAASPLSSKSGLLPTEGSKTATQTPAVGAGAVSSEKMTSGASSVSGTSHNKDPAAALDPIATNAGVAKITKEFAAVDFDHTKAEVVHAVERLGEVIAGGLSGIDAAHEGREIPAVSELWAKKGSASATSAFGKPLHDAENAISANATTGSNGVTPFQSGLAGLSSGAAAWPATANNPAAATAGFAGAAGAGASTSGSTADKARDGSSATAPTLPPVTGGPALYPADKSAPEPIKIEQPTSTPGKALAGSAGAASTAAGVTGTGSNHATHATPADAAASSTVPVASEHGNKTSETGASGSSTGPAATSTSGSTSQAPVTSATDGSTVQRSVPHDNKKPSIIQDLKAGLKGDHKAADHDASSPMIGAPVVADHEAHGLIDKKNPVSSLGVASGSTAAGGASAPSVPPTTPKKTAGTTTATPASAKTDGYNTAPSTPSGTPADRKRKSSFFHKIKSALSPSK